MLKLFSRSTPALRTLTSTTARTASAFQPLTQYRMVNSKSVDEFKGGKLFDLTGKNIIVTGGATGIGLMITQAYVANGAKVYITGRRQEALDNVVKNYNTGSGQIIALKGDVSDKADVERLAKEMAEKEPNGIHILVNNAGIARDDNTKFSSNGTPDMKSPEAIRDHFMKSEMQSWLDTMQTNVAAGFFMSMAFLPLLAKGQQNAPNGDTSSVINVSSISGAMKGSSMGQPAYAASKAAFTHVSRMLATLFKDTKVRVNVIAPGLFPSEMTAGKSDEHNKSQLPEGSTNPAGRKGEDTDMAATALLLASHGGTFYNEQIMYPDGGSTLVQPAYN